VVNNSNTGWPKQLVDLTFEQRAIREDFMRYWHEVLPRRFSLIERFNHGFSRARRDTWGHARIRTLEVGAGLGEHVAHEDLDFQHYTALELREPMAARIGERFPQVLVLVSDVQEGIPSPDEQYNRVVAVHVLEHLSNLPAPVGEIRRVLQTSRRLEAVFPCEGGLVYEVGRNVTSRRLFEKRYGCSYDWFIQAEHVNNCWEIMREIRRQFRIQLAEYWPFRVPSLQANAVVGIFATPLPNLRVDP